MLGQSRTQDMTSDVHPEQRLHGSTAGGCSTEVINFEMVIDLKLSLYGFDPVSNNDGLSNRVSLRANAGTAMRAVARVKARGLTRRLVVSSVIPPQARRVLRQAHGLAKGVLIMLTSGCIRCLEFVCG